MNPPYRLNGEPCVQFKSIFIKAEQSASCEPAMTRGPRCAMGRRRPYLSAPDRAIIIETDIA